MKGVKGIDADEDTECTMLRARATVCAWIGEIEDVTALCIELVGTRFLRHLVRALVVFVAAYLLSISAAGA